MNKSAIFICLMVCFFSACTVIPNGLTAVNDFEVNRYLGTWYEIARLDNHFERGLNNISAAYSLRDDGGVTVINKGLNQTTGKWEQAEGKAYFIDQPNEGKLKVSFFGPFYGAYNIIDLDKKGYSYSMITGPDRSYFWILSRTKQLPKNIQESLIAKAKELGFATDKLIFVTQD